MILSFLIVLALSGKLAFGVEIKKHVQNSVYPYDLDPPSYNIESWVKQLHLQQCALVEVGDKYYAIFVESRPRRYDHEKGIKEYFLGLCDDDTLNKWSFCAANLQRKRADDCNFYTKNMYNTRVHRRLCDLTLLAMNAPQCDCSNDLSDSKLYKVQGFPTCFKPPLPTSLCGDNNVCGLAGCSPRTINKLVHSIKCDRKCNEDQPFCEPCNKKSSLPRQIKSFWTDWSNPFCTDASCISQFDEAICINRETGHGDIDCLGPGTSCCTPELQNCKCHVYEEGGATKVFRTFSVPQPESVEYMSEEDFINSIPLRYLKEEFHNYPGYSPRTVRSNFGYAVKHTLAHIYDAFPFRFGNTKRKKKALKKLKEVILKPYTKKHTYYPQSTSLQVLPHSTTHILTTPRPFIPSYTTLSHTMEQSAHTHTPLHGISETTTLRAHSETYNPSLNFIPIDTSPTQIIPMQFLLSTTPFLPSQMDLDNLPGISTDSHSSLLTPVPDVASMYTLANLSPSDEDISLPIVQIETSSIMPETSISINEISKDTEDQISINQDSISSLNGEISTIHEVNMDPLDTFSSTMNPSEFEPCKRNVLNRPHVNTNGIHHKSRIHGHKPRRYLQSPFKRQNYPWLQKRPQRNSFSRILPKSPTIHKTMHIRNKHQLMDYLQTIDGDYKLPEEVCRDDGAHLIQGRNLGESESNKLSIPQNATLRRKLSFDLIFDDSKVPEEEYYVEHSRRRYPIKNVAKRQFVGKPVQKAAFEQITPAYAVFFNKDELNTPKDIKLSIKEVDPHIEKHFYARLPSQFLPNEYIPIFGSNKVESTPKVRHETDKLHAEMDDDTLHADDDEILAADVKYEEDFTMTTELDSTLLTTPKSTQTPQRQNVIHNRNIHTKRDNEHVDYSNLEDVEQSRSNFPSNQRNSENLIFGLTSPLSWQAITIPAHNDGSPVSVSEAFSEVREDDAEDLLDMEDSPGKSWKIPRHPRHNKLFRKHKAKSPSTTEYSGNSPRFKILITTQHIEAANSDKHDNTEDEDLTTMGTINNPATTSEKLKNGQSINEYGKKSQKLVKTKNSFDNKLDQWIADSNEQLHRFKKHPDTIID